MYDYGYGYSTPDYNTTSSLAGGILALVAIMIIGSLILSVLMIIAQWKIYKKAGKPGWASIVPIYNIIVLLEIAQLPIWYIALFFVPFANIYAMFKIYIELAHKFGKSTGFGVATVFFNIICLPILAFSKNCVYNGSTNSTQMNNNMQNPQPQNNNGMPDQNNFNNMPNNNMNNEIQEPLFNQNINTEINPIQPVQNNDLFNQQTQINNNTIEMSQDNNQDLQITSFEQPIVKEQSEINVTQNVEMPSEQMKNTISNGLNNQINSTQDVVNQQENIFKYEVPTLNVNQENISTQQVFTQEPTQQIIPVKDNQNVQSVNQQPQINVIPGMGVTPQPEVQNQNVINNQNNTNIQ